MIRSEFVRTSLALAALSLASSAALAQAAEPPKPDFTFTGHVDLVSRYYLRGITKTYGNGAPLGNAGADAPESDRITPQWGFDVVHSSGFYAGYFGSRINYSYEQLGSSYSDRTITDFQKNKSIENDFYAGYNGSFGDLGYTLGGTYYYYINGKAANAFESKLGLTWGAWAFSAQTLFKDVVWGNSGDTYWLATYTHPLPNKGALSASFGFYTYDKEGKYLGTRDTLAGTDCAANESFVVNGCFA